MSIIIDIGNRIKRIREDELSMNQAIFGKPLNISQAGIASIEKGRGISLESLIKISNTYKKNLDWLITGNNMSSKQLQENHTNNDKSFSNSSELIVKIAELNKTIDYLTKTNDLKDKLIERLESTLSLYERGGKTKTINPITSKKAERGTT